MVGTIEPFCVAKGDWQSYSERLEQFFLANQVEGERKVATFLTVIGEEAYSLLRTVVAPEKPSGKSFEELVGALKTHLNPKPIVIAERFKFHQRNQQEDETISSYLAELRRLTEHCDFGNYREEALRDRFVCGLVNEAIQKRLLTEKDMKLSKAHELAVGMDIASREAKDMKNRGSEALRVVQQEKPCYRCWNSGHVQEKCRFKDQKCHKCGKQGHIARVCRSYSQKQFPRGKYGRGYHSNRFIEQITRKLVT